MQKQLKAEFWTKISEISFQVMRRNWICKCACNSCFCSHRYLKVQFKIQVSADDHIDILKAKAAVRNLEFRWGETAKSRMAGRYTHRRPLSVGQGIWNLKPEFYHGFPLCAGQGIWNLKPEFYPGFPLSAGQGIWNLQPHFPLFQVPTWNVNQKADWPKSAQTPSCWHSRWYWLQDLCSVPSHLRQWDWFGDTLSILFYQIKDLLGSHFMLLWFFLLAAVDSVTGSTLPWCSWGEKPLLYQI